MNTPMKDSGIPWIGQIPQHWGTRRIKFLFKERSEKGFPDEPVLCATQKYGVIPQSIYENRVVAVNKGLEGLKLVKEGDFVISLRSFQGGIEYAHYQGIISAAYTVLIPSDEVNPNYIKHLFKSHSFIELLQTCVTGIREGQNINYDLLRTNDIPLPPLPEQEAIADFLDEKCREVDTMVDIQVQFIEQLKAYKQSLIAETVTHGLNPTAPRKDSHIDWIGLIPQHWEVCRLKEVIQLRTGTTPKNYQNHNEEDTLVNWYTPSDVCDEGNVIQEAERKLASRVIQEENIDLYPKGTIIFVGIGASAGKVGFAVKEGYSNQQITALIPKVGIGKYWYYFLIACRKYIRDNAFYTTLPIINNGYLSQTSLLYPPLPEQEAIADFLDRKCSEIDQIIALKQQKINALHEYKKSIIYEYVTGKRNING